MTTKPSEGNRVVATNRQARRDYEILETFEAGLVLRGSEVKSLRDGRANVKDAYAELVGDELYLVHLHISPYAQAGPMGHEPERRRKLLMRRRELERLRGKLVERGLALVPLSIYFKGRWVKVELGLGRGKKQYDKRQDIADRESKREMARAMRRDQKSGGQGRGARMRAAVLAAITAALAVGTAYAAETVPLLVRWGPRVEPERVDALIDDGTLYLPVNVVARWFGAVKEWDPASLTLTLRTPRHTVKVISGNRWVTVDGKLVNLAAPVRLARGALEVPAAFVEELAPRLLERRVHWEPGRGILTFHPPDVNVLRVDFGDGTEGTLDVHVEFAESLGFELDATRPGEIRLRIENGAYETGVAADTYPVLPVRRVLAAREGTTAEIIFEMADDGGTATATPSSGGRGAEITFTGFVPETIEPQPLESRPFPTRPLDRDRPGRRAPVIVIDPGHGGSERGAIGPTGFLEKKVTLEIALQLKRILEDDGTFRVILTREEDRLQPLVRRAGMANLFTADLFLSIHANSWPGGVAEGFEVYVANRGAPETTPDDMNPGSSGGPLRWEAAQGAYIHESRLLAGFVREELRRLGLRDRGTRSAKFVVLRGVAAPAVLVETAFISNPAEEAKLQDPDFQREIAAALAEAVRRFAPTPASNELQLRE